MMMMMMMMVVVVGACVISDTELKAAASADGKYNGFFFNRRMQIWGSSWLPLPYQTHYFTKWEQARSLLYIVQASTEIVK